MTIVEIIGGMLRAVSPAFHSRKSPTPDSAILARPRAFQLVSISGHKSRLRRVPVLLRLVSYRDVG
jgi:hypothetical protein